MIQHLRRGEDEKRKEEEEEEEERRGEQRVQSIYQSISQRPREMLLLTFFDKCFVAPHQSDSSFVKSINLEISVDTGRQGRMEDCMGVQIGG